MPLWAFILAAAASAQPHPEQLRDLYRQHLAEQQHEYGEFDARTAEAARDLGLFLRAHNDSQSAHDAFTRAIAIDEKVFGPDARRTLADVADLASVSPIADAPQLFERAAKSSDPAAASRALVALGEMSASQGDSERAARYWRQALNRQDAAAPDSANAAMILNVLAQVVDPPEAIPLLQRALALDRKLYGPDYPETGGVDQLLAQALLATHKAAEAIGPAREALTILTTKLGPDHPRTASAANTLADALRANNKFTEAERYYRDALAADEKVLGPQHSTTLDDVRTLAAFLRERGKVTEAIELERRLVVNVAR